MESTRSFETTLEEVFKLCHHLAEEHNREIAVLNAKLDSAERAFTPASVESMVSVVRAETPIKQPSTPGTVEEPARHNVSPQPASVENAMKAWQGGAGPKRNVRLFAGAISSADSKGDQLEGKDEGTNSQIPHYWHALSLSVKKEKICEALHDRAHQVQQFSVEIFKARDVWNKDDDTLLRIKRKAQTENPRVSMRAVNDTTDDTPEDWFMIHPQSNKRLLWDLAGILWLAFDVVMLPAQVFPLPDSVFFDIMDFFGNLFWTADVGASFITGTYNKSIPVMNFKSVAHRYIRSWLAFDAFIVLIGWGSVAMESMTGMESLQVARAARTARFLRILRYLRLVRLLRVVKSFQIVDDLQARANSEGTLFAFGVLKLMATVVFMSHILACCWYGVGNVPDGWVRTEPTHNETGIHGWDVGDQYLYTYQWSLSRLHPSTIEKNLLLRTTNERVFGVFGGLCAMVVGAGFISMITNLMREFQEKHKRRKRNLALVQAYVLKYEISPPLAVRAKRYIELEHEAKLRSQREAELLTILPHDLVLDFRYEAFSPVTSKHDFFAEIHRKHLRTHYDLCHQALSAEMALASEILFTTGDACGKMRFVTSGFFCYTLGSEKRDRSGHGRTEHEDEHERFPLKVGTALSEAVLWTPWEHHGELYAKTSGAVLTVLAEEFAAVIQRHEQAHVAAAIHARCFIEELNSMFVSELSDLPSLAEGGDIPEIPIGRRSGSIIVRAKSLLVSKKLSEESHESSALKQFRRSLPDGFDQATDYD